MATVSPSNRPPDCLILPGYHLAAALRPRRSRHLRYRPAAAGKPWPLPETTRAPPVARDESALSTPRVRSQPTRKQNQRTDIGEATRHPPDRSFLYPPPNPNPANRPLRRASHSPPQITPGARGRGPTRPPRGNNKQGRTSTRHRRTKRTGEGRENGRDPHRLARCGGVGRRGNGGHLLLLAFRTAAGLLKAGAPAQPRGRPPPSPADPDPDHGDGAPRAARRRVQPARRLPLLPHPLLARAAAGPAETAGPPRRLRRCGAEGGRAGGGGATAGGVRGAAVPAVRGAAAVARRRAGVAVEAVPALRPLLRAQLVQRQGGRLRALGPPPRRPPRLLLLLPRHGLRHPRPGPAPPRRPRLPPLPREQPPHARARWHRRRSHLPRHVHLRTEDDPDPVPDEPRAAADGAELRGFLRRFCEEGRVVVGQADRRREAEAVNKFARLVLHVRW